MNNIHKGIVKIKKCHKTFHRLEYPGRGYGLSIVTTNVGEIFQLVEKGKNG